MKIWLESASGFGTGGPLLVQVGLLWKKGDLNLGGHPALGLRWAWILSALLLSSLLRE